MWMAVAAVSVASLHGYKTEYGKMYGTNNFTVVPPGHIYFIIIIKFTSLGTGGHTQEAEPVRDAYP